VPWAKLAANAADAHLTVGSFNRENYENQGKPYAKDKDIAEIIVNNMHCPDVVVGIEMGDDKASTVIYVNQDNSYAIPDGVVTAVQNLKGIAAQIKSLSGLDYGFRCIDPEENKDGGAPGVNIRPCFFFRKDRVSFVDRGTPTNTDENTASADQSAWKVTFPSECSLTLARTGTAACRDSAGQIALTQSPGRIVGSPFNNSRKPLAGEFVFTATGKKFFVIAAHLGSKTGDTPLYGTQQPPAFGSDAKRAEQGKAIHAFVQSLLSTDPSALVAVAGDMNDFPWADALQVLTGEVGGSRVLYSVSKEFMPANEQYSYAFQGNLQQIDHIFVSPAFYSAALAGGAPSDYTSTVCIPHIDSLFSKNNHVQTSDHDPIVVRLGGL